MVDRRTQTRRLRRAAAAVAASAVALPLVVTGSAGANVVDRGPVPTDDLCEGVPGAFAPFDDVDGGTSGPSTVCLAYARITHGTSGGAYVPGGTVTREQMATFIARTMDVAVELDLVGATAALPTWDGQNRFSDVTTGSPHVGSINRLAAAGIVMGGPGGAPAHHFCARQSVSRAQMASFLTRALAALVGELEPADRSPFSDTSGNAHRAAVDLVAEHGITVGDGTGRYRPAAALSRGQMAVFLVRTLATLEFAELITPLPTGR
jgi:hypothetical protein